MEHFHYRLCDIGDLTDRQIDDLCFHKRDDKGEVVEVQARQEKLPSLPGELMAIDLLAADGVITRENADECKRKLIQKYKAG